VFKAGSILRGVIREPGGSLGMMNRLLATSDGRAQRMTKAELVAQVAQKIELTNKQTAQIVDLFLQCIVTSLEEGDKVELRGFGSFRCRARGPRQGRNPKTGDVVEVPARATPYFRAGKTLHARLNPSLTASSSLT
jgi:integration host factor subunit beta